MSRGINVRVRAALGAAATVMLLAASPAFSLEWATCKFTYQPAGSDEPERRCVEIQLPASTSAGSELVRTWCMQDLPAVDPRLEAGRTCPKGPSCVRDSESVLGKVCRPPIRNSLGEPSRVQCANYVSSTGLVLALQYVDYGGSDLATFCEQQGGRLVK